MVQVSDILSMEAKLCVMEYKEGSRSHSVQENAIFKDSCIRVFTADRAVLYETIEKDLEEMGLDRSACWFHARHYFVDAYISDYMAQWCREQSTMFLMMRRLSRFSCKTVALRCITMPLNECSAIWQWADEIGCILAAIKVRKI